MSSWWQPFKEKNAIFPIGKQDPALEKLGEQHSVGRSISDMGRSISDMRRIWTPATAGQVHFFLPFSHCTRGDRVWVSQCCSRPSSSHSCAFPSFEEALFGEISEHLTNTSNVGVWDRGSPMCASQTEGQAQKGTTHRKLGAECVLATTAWWHPHIVKSRRTLQGC